MPPITDNKTLKQLYNAFDAFPLSPENARDRALYVDCQKVRGDSDILHDLGQHIEWSDKPTCQLYAGHRGAGKSTELLRLRHHLREQGYYVVYFAADEGDIDPEDARYTDILLACVRQLLMDLQATDSNPLGRWLKQVGTSLRQFAETEMTLEMAADVEVPLLFGRLTANLRGSPSVRKQIRDEVDPHTVSLLEALNAFIAEAQHGGITADRLVLIVDNLDRIVPIFNDDTQRTNHQEIFIDRSEQLTALNCHVIYTVPISMVYSEWDTTLNNRYDNVATLPTVMIHKRGMTRRLSLHGIQVFKELLEKRSQQAAGLAITEVLRDDNIVAKLCLMSGGNLGNLMQLIQSTLQHLPQFSDIEQAMAQSVIMMRDMHLNATDEAERARLAALNVPQKIHNRQETEYQSLRNALTRSVGFNVFFVECSPAQNARLMARLGADLLHKKRLQVLTLPEEVTDLYAEFASVAESTDVVFMVGYARQGNDKDNSVSNGLSRFNLQLEQLRRDFPHLSLVFLLPQLGMTGFIRQAQALVRWKAFIFSEEYSLYENLADPNMKNKVNNVTFLNIIAIFVCIFDKECLAAYYYILLGFLYRFLRKFDSLLYICDRALKNAPKGDFLEFILWFIRGFSLGELKRYEEAIASYNKALDISSDYQTISWHSRGTILKKLKRYEEAIASYDKALEINPNRHKTWSHRGATLYDLEKYEEALVNFDNALKIYPNYAKAWRSRGDVLCHLERYEEALISFDKALKINSNDDKAWRSRGDALSDLGRYKAAAGSFHKALKINPNDNKTWYSRGNALFNLEKYKKAIRNFDKALKINANDSDTWCYRGCVFYTLERYEEAISDFNKALEINPNDDWAWYYRSYSFDILERYEDAVASYDKHLEMNLNDDRAWCDRGIALKKLEQYEEAIASYDKALAINPNNDDVWYNRGNALKKLEKYEEAIANYDKALEIKPNDDTWHNRGNALKKLERYEEAITNYDKAIAINPYDDASWHNRGYALGKLGRHEEAIASYDKALEIDPYDDGTWYNRGITFLKLKRYQEATEAFNQGLQHSPENLSLLSNDLELAIIQQDITRAKRRLAKLQWLLETDDQLYAIVPFLAWLLHPNTHWQPILNACEQLDTDVKINWDFNDTIPALDRLTSPQRQIADTFIKFFENQITLAQLRSQLEALSQGEPH